MNTYKFANHTGINFTKELKESVNQYFASKKISKSGDYRMLIKSAVMLSLFLIPLIVLSTGVVSNVALLFGLYLISGLGMAGIGMSVMHDALHGSFSSKKSVNKIMGWSINLIGADPTVWKIQHNVLHHTYTNIDEADDDLHIPGILRFSPDQNRYWIHRFQFVYAWILYGLMTLIWVTTRDFTRLGRYMEFGFIKSKGEYNRLLVSAAFWKLFYFSYALVLPLIMLPMAWWVIVVAFLSMHFVTGIILSVIFQMGHIMPTSEFPQPDENGLIGQNWSIHQLATTCNFAPSNRILSWYVGGLNYQIEHHLMPHVCHVHYRDISKIVRATAEKYGIPYHTQTTLFEALRSHTDMLYQLGRA
ncbi:fatty acid desaturase family protein [Marinoscillum sp.]|uniref:fatty acid desaturase family protein n=1 Tax=Marinoscillum sp. TaxID=2024838 RepID=UPI003BAB9808